MAETIVSERPQRLPRSRPVTVVVGVLITVAIVATAWYAGDQRGWDQIGRGGVNLKLLPTVGEPVPGRVALDAEGGTVFLSDFRGKPVWLNFWDSQCPPCRAEMPEMQKLYDELKDQVEFVGVSMGPRDSAQGVEQFVKLENYTWKFVHDPELDVMTNYRVTGIPSSYFIDKDGIIRAIHVGGADYALLESNLKKALNTQ